MKRYVFTAGSEKSEILTALSLPFCFGLNILLVNLFLFYLPAHRTLPGQTVLYMFLTIFAVCAAWYSVKKIQRALLKTYTVELNNRTVTIRNNATILLSGPLQSCHLHYNLQKRIPCLKLTIRTDEQEITFIGRNKSFTTIKGTKSLNIFGTCTTADINTLCELSRDLQMLCEKDSPL